MTYIYKLKDREMHAEIQRNLDPTFPYTLTELLTKAFAGNRKKSAYIDVEYGNGFTRIYRSTLHFFREDVEKIKIQK